MKTNAIIGAKEASMADIRAALSSAIDISMQRMQHYLAADDMESLGDEVRYLVRQELSAQDYKEREGL